MELFKKKEKEEPKNYLTPDAKVYFQYDLGKGERILTFIIGFVIGVVVGYIFYGLPFVSLLLGIGVGVFLVPLRRKQVINKQIVTLKKQFKSLLESISTSIGAGRNVIDSFANALTDMKEQYSDEAYIVKETGIILSGLNNNINIEDLLRDMAERSGIDDIMTFADVFDTCYRKGGDIKEVIASTYNIINDKIEIEMEIKTMIASAKAELSMMCAMPVVFVFVLNMMGSNITGRGTTSGYIATTVSLAIFIAAYFLGRKLMSIKL